MLIMYICCDYFLQAPLLLTIVIYEKDIRFPIVFYAFILYAWLYGVLSSLIPDCIFSHAKRSEHVIFVAASDKHDHSQYDVNKHPNLKQLLDKIEQLSASVRLQCQMPWYAGRSRRCLIIIGIAMLLTCWSSFYFECSWNQSLSAGTEVQILTNVV